MCNLGYCYYTGIGVAEDEAEAVIWFRKAADRGQPRALFLLGECYEEGNGVQANLQKALEYYQKAADKGYKSAQEAIARLNGRPAGPYAYAAPEPPKAAAPQEKGPDKKKKGGLFGFFKK